MKIQQLFINRVVQKPNIGTKKQIGKPGELHNYRIIKNEQLIKQLKAHELQESSKSSINSCKKQ